MKVLRWRVTPVHEEPGKAMAVLAVLAAVIGTVYLAEQKVEWAALAALLFFLGMHDFFFHTEFQLDQNRITVRHFGLTKSREWNEFRSTRETSRGIVLCTTTDHSRLDHFRGLLLLFGRNSPERASVRDFIAKNLASGKTVGGNSSDE